MIRFYLGEEPILHNVPTWLLRNADDLEYTLEHLHELVVKEVHGAGGYGMLIGPAATRAEIEDFRATHPRRARQLHRAADAGAVDLPDLRRVRRRAAAHRPAALRAVAASDITWCPAG